MPYSLPTDFWPTVTDPPLVQSKSVCNLGVYLNEELTLETHVNKTVGTCFSLIRVLRKLLPLLPAQMRSLVIRSVILSRLDYCNSLLLESPKFRTGRLQRIQNMAAKLALSRPRYSSPTQALADLHWLPIEQRIFFKSLCIVFKSLHGLGPIPLQNKFHWYVPSRCLRSSAANWVKVPSTRRARWGGKAFSVAAAKLWNKLPQELCKTPFLLPFRKKIKTCLFPRI